MTDISELYYFRFSDCIGKVEVFVDLYLFEEEKKKEQAAKKIQRAWKRWLVSQKCHF